MEEDHADNDDDDKVDDHDYDDDEEDDDYDDDDDIYIMVECIYPVCLWRKSDHQLDCWRWRYIYNDRVYLSCLSVTKKWPSLL